MKAKYLIEQLKLLRPECEINVRTEGDIWRDFTLDVKGADPYFVLIHLEPVLKEKQIKKRKGRKMSLEDIKGATSTLETLNKCGGAEE